MNTRTKAITSTMGMLILLLSAMGAPATAETPDDLEPLRQGLSFHCSFDAGADADLARGDGRVHTLLRATPLKTKPGLSVKHVTMEETAGRHGGAMRFNRPSQQTLLYRDAVNLGYTDNDWSGTVSLWLNLDPDQDLISGLNIDPIHITGATPWNDASMWFTFTHKPPWPFIFGAFPDLEVWNPEGKTWDEIPPADLPRIEVKDPPFARGKWTHIVFTFSGLNRHGQQGVARLYLDGEFQGEISKDSQIYTWDPATVAVHVGYNYIGLIDDFAVFDRALSAAEIKTLHALPAGVAGLHPAAR